MYSVTNKPKFCSSSNSMFAQGCLFLTSAGVRYVHLVLCVVCCVEQAVNASEKCYAVLCMYISCNRNCQNCHKRYATLTSAEAKSEEQYIEQQRHFELQLMFVLSIYIHTHTHTHTKLLLYLDEVWFTLSMQHPTDLFTQHIRCCESFVTYQP